MMHAHTSTHTLTSTHSYSRHTMSFRPTAIHTPSHIDAHSSIGLCTYAHNSLDIHAQGHLDPYLQLLYSHTYA